MSEAKFTKGEWVHDGWGCIECDGELVADAMFTGDQEELANINLISAAPEMYDALESILMGWDLEPSHMDWIGELLEKARGE